MDKVIVVTGATSGLGQAAAIDFAKSGAKVFLVGRDAARGAEVQAQAPGSVWIAGDVSTKAGVKAVGEAVRAQTSRVDVLMNNAGGTFDAEGRTADGVERTLALNVLGPWLLEKELHAALAAAKGRVVNVATGFLDRYPVDVDDLPAPKRYSGLTQYARAKNALVMLTIEQAARFAPEGITVVSLNPGIVMGTRFGGGQPKIAQWIGGPIMRAIGIACTLDEAVRRFRMAAFDDVPTGSYISRGVLAPQPKPAQDPATRTAVMSLLDRL